MELEYKPFIEEWKSTLKAIQRNLELYVHEFRDCAGPRCPLYCDPKHDLDITTAFAWELHYVVMFVADGDWTVESSFDRTDSIENAVSYHEEHNPELYKLANNTRQVIRWIIDKRTKEDVLGDYNGKQKIRSITSELQRAGSESEY